MILGLPIDGTPVCGPVSPDGWRDSVGATIGIRPSDVPVDQKDKKSSGIHSGWLTAHFDPFRMVLWTESLRGMLGLVC
jgi:hypothetical protein